MSFLVSGDLVRAPGIKLGTGALGGKKANSATATEQVAALTFSVTGKPWVE